MFLWSHQFILKSPCLLIKLDYSNQWSSVNLHNLNSFTLYGGFQICLGLLHSVWYIPLNGNQTPFVMRSAVAWCLPATLLHTVTWLSLFSAKCPVLSKYGGHYLPVCPFLEVVNAGVNWKSMRLVHNGFSSGCLSDPQMWFIWVWKHRSLWDLYIYA